MDGKKFWLFRLPSCFNNIIFIEITVSTGSKRTKQSTIVTLILRRFCAAVIYFLVINYWYLLTSNVYYLQKLMVLNWGSPISSQFSCNFGSGFDMWIWPNDVISVKWEEEACPSLYWRFGGQIGMFLRKVVENDQVRPWSRYRKNRWTSWTLFLSSVTFIFWLFLSRSTETIPVQQRRFRTGVLKPSPRGP